MRSHFAEELESVRRNMLLMGDLTLESVSYALKCVVKTEGATYEEASELEFRIDDLNRSIHNECLNILTLQAPVARDARLVIGILEGIVDLEQIGDYAFEASDLALNSARCPVTQVTSQVVAFGEGVRDMLAIALDTWKNLDRAQGLALRSRQASVRTDCQNLTDKLNQLVTSPGGGQVYISLILICKHFERMAHHAVSVAEQAAAAAPAER
jgi:phosphate transport system protein